MRLKESHPAKQDRGHGTRQLTAADAAHPEFAGAGFQVDSEAKGGNGTQDGLSFIPETRDSKSRLVHYVCLVLFLAQCIIVWVRLWAPAHGFWHGRWPEAMLLLTATAAILSSLARELPLQNVLLAGGLLGLAGLGLEGLNATFGVPFGRIRFSPASGPLLFSHLPWCMPFVWVLLLLGARGVARFVLAPTRSSSNYGFYILGLTVLLVSGFHLSLESFAVRIAHYWEWSSGPFGGWLEPPGFEWLGRAATTLVIMALVTPILFDKKPAPQRPLPFPVILWLMLLFFFLTAGAVNRLWPLFSITLIQVILIAGLAWHTPVVRRPKGSVRPVPAA